MTNVGKVETVLILDWNELPESLQDDIVGWHSFGNDRFLTHWSMLIPRKEKVDESVFRKMYADRCQAREYMGTFEEFLIEFNLELDWWLKDQPFDLTNVTKILIRICW